MLECSRGMAMGRRRFALDGLLTIRMLDPAPVAALAQERLTMGQDGVCQRPDAQPPSEEQ
jgi:hypothetical protein